MPLFFFIPRCVGHCFGVREKLGKFPNTKVLEALFSFLGNITAFSKVRNISVCLNSCVSIH